MVAAALALAAVVVTGCVAGDARFNTMDPAGFWVGLWHGIISVVTLIISAFNEGVEVYERNNTGAWYDFGFLLGVVFTWGASVGAAMRGRTRRRRT